VAFDDEGSRRSTGAARHEQELGRLLALSDGVFAIAITLLVLQLTVPEISGGGVASKLGGQLVAAIPNIITYCIGFVVIALFWISHRRIFVYIVRSDAVLTLLNLGLLLCIAFMPFPTAIISLYGNTAIAVIFYTSTLALASLVNLVIWLWAGSGHRLISREVSPRVVRSHAWRAVVAPAVFILSIPVALWNPTAAELSWLLILVVSQAISRAFSAKEPSVASG
jgi:uncharacterized membrane protein